MSVSDERVRTLSSSIPAELVLEPDADVFEALTFWTRADMLSITASGPPPRVEQAPNLATTSEISTYVVTQSNSTFRPYQTSISGAEALTFNVIDGATTNEEMAITEPDGTNAGLGTLIGDGTKFHFFCVFHVTQSFVRTSTNVYTNHRIVGNPNGQRYWGVYGRSNAGAMTVSPYIWDGSQKFNDHVITIGEIHLMEFWKSGSTMYSKMDSGSVASTAAGAPTVFPLGNYLGGISTNQYFSGSIFEAVYYSSSLRVGSADNDNVTALRTYFGNRYGVPV